MPRAPRYEPQRDNIETSGTRFAAANDGGGVAAAIGQGLQQLGGAASQAVEAEDQLQEVRTARLMKAQSLEYQQQAAALEQQYTSLEGMNAVTAEKEYRENLKALRDQYMGSAEGGRAQRILGEMIDPFEAQINLKMQGHMLGQEKAVYENTLKGEEVMAADNAVASYTNIEARNGYMADLMDVIDEQATHYGWDEKTVAAKKKVSKSGVHYSTIQAMSAEPDMDPLDVQAYFEANMDDMISEHRNSVMTALQAPLERRSAIEGFNEIVSGLSSLSTSADEGGDGDAAPATSNQLPVSGGTVTNDYAAHEARGSKGYDIAADAGSAIVPTSDGEVIDKGFNGKAGNWVMVRHADGHTTSYSHMQQKSSFAIGDRVTRSSVIGTVGSTGKSSGPHVHIRVRDPQGNDMDPEEYLNGAAVTASPDTPRRWDVGQINGAIDERVESGKWTVEKGERVREEAMRRMNRDNAALDENESEAYREAQSWLVENIDSFTDYAMVPKNIRDRLSPAARLSFIGIAKSGKAALAEGSRKANGPKALELTIQSITNPTAFANMDLTEAAAELTPAEYKTFVTKQLEIQQGNQEWTPDAGVSKAFTRMARLDGTKYDAEEKAAILTQMIDRAYRMRSQNGDKPLTDAEYNEAFQYAVGEVTEVRKIFGIDSLRPDATIPRYKADDLVEGAKTRVEAQREIGAQRRARQLQERRETVIDTFRQEYGRKPTESEIERWLRLVP